MRPCRIGTSSGTRRGLLANQKAQRVGRARAGAPVSLAFPGGAPASRLPLIDMLFPAQRPRLST